MTKAKKKAETKFARYDRLHPGWRDNAAAAETQHEHYDRTCRSPANEAKHAAVKRPVGIITAADVKEPMITVGRSVVPLFARDHDVFCSVSPWVVVKASRDPIETRTYVLLVHVAAVGWVLAHEGLTDLSDAMTKATLLANHRNVGPRRGLGLVPSAADLKLPGVAQPIPGRKPVVVPAYYSDAATGNTGRRVSTHLSN
jgi:hypothetical protein